MAQPSWIGQTLGGRYLIDTLLGQGGMSAVYKAFDPNLKRVVGIKLIHSHLSGDSQFVQRFEEEAAAVASLRHPNIVQVFDFNSDQGVSYMVMEFIPGETLQERLRRLNEQKRPMAVDEALRVALNVCEALVYSHQRGMVHRDLKPANIMLDIYGQAILMDFGIVKIMGGTSHTATGAVMGTARYMSPEVIRAEPADPRSDLYSLGVTLFEMLSGRPPYDADSAMTLMMMHLNDPVPDPLSLRADLPSAVVQILLKAMAKDRNSRYQSASAMAEDLKRLLAALETKTSVNPVPAVPSQDQSAVTILPPMAARQNQNAAASTGTTGAPTRIEPARPTPSGQYAAPVSAQYGMPPQEPEKSKKWMWVAGIGGFALLFITAAILMGYLLLSNVLGGSANPTATSALVQLLNTEIPVVVLATATQEPSRTSAPLPTETPVPPTLTLIPSETPPPTATYPPLYVRINAITINSSNSYQVDYETFGYTEVLPGQHVHFFFNSVTPEQAGMPGSGPWILYGGPRPFTGYRVSDRPGNATQMCALVANSNHTIILESGNCLDLP
jgi:serine/threonine protein kinase